MTANEIRLIQPDRLADEWLKAQKQRPKPTDDQSRLQAVLALAALTIAHDSGGPFAAAVYALDTGELISTAVNTVVSNHCAAAHAELQALSLAQQKIGNYTLIDRPCVLVSSSEPCTMCLGAIAWSGIQQLVFSSTREDVEQIGFDEGPITREWRQQLTERGIRVSGPMLREEGRQILRDYLNHQGVIYNARPLGPAQI
ncbi:nucleoside deaminase [Alcanivorax sp. 1008]|uniref:nucleoside deaminase n=1 Tax=Alcanivorax sp. 1008 TaxID=2816853 RepID=UPI001D32C2D2|nr:deaminase [Alcanivorax sp. 1008]MCC1497061.1 nucleoside deaminase [Alcanivorax sp. 1008]